MTGLAELRQTFSNFLAIGPKLTINPERTVLAGDTALVIGNWRLTGRDPDGHDINIAGRFAEVVRRQPDGRWLYVIDNPNGSD